MKKSKLLLCIVALITTSCSSTKNSFSGILTMLNAKWVLQSLAGQSGLGDLFGSKLPFLQFDTNAGKLSGYNGCNTISGPLQIEQGNKINFAQLAGTKMACEGQGESLFMNTLSKVTNFKVDNGVLKLLNQGQEVISLIKSN